MQHIKAECAENASEQLFTFGLLTLQTRSQSWFIFDGWLWVVEGQNVYNSVGNKEEHDKLLLAVEEAKIARSGEAGRRLFKHDDAFRYKISTQTKQEAVGEAFFEGVRAGYELVAKTKDIPFNREKIKLPNLAGYPNYWLDSGKD